MPILQRLINVAITLAQNTQTNQPNKFSGTNSSSILVSGARTSVRISNSGAPTSSEATVNIYGLSLSLMNELSTLGAQRNLVPNNTLNIAATGDATGGFTNVFSGTILEAYGDFNAAPNVPFRMKVQSGLGDATLPALATGYDGSTDVATIMAGFARLRNLGFENNGVNIQLDNPYFSGSVFNQMRECAEHANIMAEVINGNVLSIWPKFGSRTSVTTIPIIAAPPDGQMIDSPSFTQQGVLVKNVFDPRISFGARFKLASTVVEKANGIWVPYKIDLALDAQVPHGKWEMSVYGYSGDQSNPVIPPK